MLYHPHAHFLVSAGGLSADGESWQPAKHSKFLVPVRALSILFRAKFRAGLKKAGLLVQVPVKAWQQAWVVHAQAAGKGDQVLDYLGRYVFRIAITQSRLESLEEGRVTFRYRDNRTQQTKHVCLPVAEFVERFLQHVLPQGLPKVRHYGLDASACQKRHSTAMALLKAPPVTLPGCSGRTPARTVSTPAPPGTGGLRCAHCGSGRLRWLGQLLPSKKVPP
jgi:hypothetical protein